MTKHEREQMMKAGPGEASRGAKVSGPTSFLVRMWREAQSEGEGPVRVYLRNVHTGEEFYLGDPMRVGEVLSQQADIIGRPDADSNDSNTEAAAQVG